MNILITESFLNQLRSRMGKQKILIEDIADALYKDLTTNSEQTHYLERPHLKQRMRVNKNKLRILSILDEENNMLIPTLVEQKSNKRYGQNMQRLNIADLAIAASQRSEKDLRN